MNLERRCIFVFVVPALGLGLSGCSAYSTMKDLPLECDVENAYEFDPMPVPLANSYPAASDMTAGITTVAVAPIPEGGLCGATTALVITASHNNDWGALAGFYSFGVRDESAYQGLSFWARAPGPSNKSFTLALDDANTYAADPDAGAGTNCRDYGADGGVGGPTGGGIDPATNMPIPGVSIGVLPADACGNQYTNAMTVTTDWRLYTVPFTEFHQTSMPNRAPNQELTERGPLPKSGLLTNKLMNIVIRLPRDATTELWIAKLTFYRNKPPGTSGDGAVSAP
jgi:hypothetical protein